MKWVIGAAVVAMLSAPVSEAKACSGGHIPTLTVARHKRTPPPKPADKTPPKQEAPKADKDRKPGVAKKTDTPKPSDTATK